MGGDDLGILSNIPDFGNGNRNLRTSISRNRGKTFMTNTDSITGEIKP